MDMSRATGSPKPWKILQPYQQSGRFSVTVCTAHILLIDFVIWGSYPFTIEINFDRIPNKHLKVLYSPHHVRKNLQYISKTSCLAVNRDQYFNAEMFTYN